MGYINRSANPNRAEHGTKCLPGEKTGAMGCACSRETNPAAGHDEYPRKMTFSPNALQRPYTRLALFRQAGDI
jgi:hypothetical protein